MRHATLLVCPVFLVAMAATSPVHAQDEAPPLIYASYWKCGPGAEDLLDRLPAAWDPAIQPQMDAGAVDAWGILTHDTGNEWTISIYHVGSDFTAIRGALSAAAEAASQADAGVMDALGSACLSHEDYLWANIASSDEAGDLAADRSAAGLSIYWECAPGREGVADMIFQDVIVPALDEQVAAGRLANWSWNAHVIGGKYRRLLAMDGPDAGSLLDALGAFGDAFAATPQVGVAFSEVCYSHQDNLYNIAVSRP